jgi:hypothetical protein
MLMDMNNGFKSAHGKAAHEALYTKLSFLRDQKLIADFEKEYRNGREGYAKDQFYAPFIIEYDDGELWLLYSTTSFRSDRFKGQQWDASNLRQIDHCINLCYLVYPDSVDEKERREFLDARSKIVNSQVYSAIDDILTLGQLTDEVEKKSNEYKSKGKIKDSQGRFFEESVVNVLSSRENLDKLSGARQTDVGVQYQLFEKIANAFNLPKDICSIEATTDVGKLPSNGQPKADVLARVTYADGAVVSYTISCKRTAAEKVSVHQYPAEKFADVLDGSNRRLRCLLMGFQEAGGITAFGIENCQELSQVLTEYKEKLALWVLGGICGDGDADTQWAKYLLVCRGSEEYEIHKVEDYYHMLLDKGAEGHFGTVFTWTYASGAKGKSIQLKVKIL